MNVFFGIFRTVVWFSNLYTLIIFVRILITWIPSVAQSTFGRFLGKICDPYLAWFKRFRWLRTSTLDFTPVLAIACLVLVSSVFSQFVLAGRFSIGIVLSAVIGILWSFVSSFITFVNLFLAVRLVFNLLDRDSASGFWQRMDAVISPVAYKITARLLPGKFVQYRTVLIIALIILILAQIAGRFVFGFAEQFFMRLPF